MSENRESVQGKYFGTAGQDDFDKDGAYAHGVGAYWWNTDRSILWILIPANTKHGYCLSPWHIKPAVNDCGHCWDWDGNIDKPTLSPSLHAVGIWHGYIRAGELVSV